MVPLTGYEDDKDYEKRYERAFEAKVAGRNDENGDGYLDLNDWIESILNRPYRKFDTEPDDDLIAVVNCE